MKAPKRHNATTHKSKFTIINKGLTDKRKKIIDAAMRKIVREYREVLELLDK